LFLLFAAPLVLNSAAQSPIPLSLKQPREGEPAQVLSASERGELGDPLFNCLLKDHAEVVEYAKVESLIQPDPKKRHTFVVDEGIANPQLGQARRTVITFTGSNPTTGEILTSNLMLSVFFDAQAFPSPGFIEAWGWDNVRGRYNYYKLDDTGTPDGRLTWKFRASSVGADRLTFPERRATCLACHINGGPIMKEVSFPWNNWHSFKSPASYLTSGQGWPVAHNAAIASGRLNGAETLETDGILPSIRQFNNRRINEAIARQDADGNIAVNGQGIAEVIAGKRLLRSLFFTTEFNIISSAQKSGLHPFSGKPTGAPATDVEIPNTFFLNANLIAGGTPAKYLGLDVPEAAQFSATAKVSPAEYKRLVEASNVQLGGIRPADTDFAWFVPEPSAIDNDMIDRLMRRGIVSKEFVASVILVDLEQPMLSADRESLWQFVPDKFTFMPPKPNEGATAGITNSDLVPQIIAALRAQQVKDDSPAGKWLHVLESGNPINELRKGVTAYLDRTKQKLGTDQARQQELTRLYNVMLQRRQAILHHPVLRALNETGDRLFPIVESVIENPHHRRQ
jgi:hypothetical protein